MNNGYVQRKSWAKQKGEMEMAKVARIFFISGGDVSCLIGNEKRSGGALLITNKFNIEHMENSQCIFEGDENTLAVKTRKKIRRRSKYHSRGKWGLVLTTDRVKPLRLFLLALFLYKQKWRMQRKFIHRIQNFLKTQSYW